MSRIKEKLSSIFAAQIPEFIRVGESVAENRQVISVDSTKHPKIVNVRSTLDIVAGDKLIYPAITNTVFVTKILSSSSVEVSDNINVTLSNVSAKFVRTDTTSNFVKFLEAYYKFLEQDQHPQELLQNSRLYADIDYTIDSLIENFFVNYGNDLPRNIVADKRTFVKHFKDIYKTKGTEEAYKLLFRVLFNTGATFKYPKDVILKASDGIWIKDYTIRVIASSTGNPFDLINTKIVGQTSGATAVVENVLKLRIKNTDIYELYLSKIKGTFVKENIVSRKLITAPNVYSTIQVTSIPILTKIDVIEGAVGYNANSNIIISGVYAKITELTSTGKIKNITIVEPSIYINTPLVTYNVGSVISSEIDYPATYITGNITISQNIGTFTSDNSHGLIKGKFANIIGYGNTSSYLNNCENTISISTVLDDKRFRFAISPGSNNTSLSAILKYTEKAVISPKLGIVKESSGYWSTNRGKLSELNYIQGPSPNSPDKNKIYYQPYSYVVQSDVTVDNWKNIASATVHPAGTEVFGEILINNNISGNLETSGNAEIWDYFSLTTDSNLYPFYADMTTYTNSRVTNLSVTTDAIYSILGYL